MPFNQRRVKKGEPIKAVDFNSLLDEVHRLSKVTVHPPLFLTQSANGIQISLNSPVHEVAYVKFEKHADDTYPTGTDGCKIYPAIKRPKANIEEATTCTDEVEDNGDTPEEKGEEIKVFVLHEQHIPDGTIALVYRSGGSWFTDYVRESIRGKLDTEMAVDGSVEMSVWAAVDGGADADTEENVTVSDWLMAGEDTITKDTKVVAFFDRESKKYYIGSAQCPNAEETP